MQSKIDNALTGFIGQLFAQRRRSAFPGPRGGAIVSDPKTADRILRNPAQFPKTFKLLEAVGQNRFSTNGEEWQWRRELTQRSYLEAGKTLNRGKIAEVYRRRLADCDGTEPAAINSALLAASTEIFHDAFGTTVAIEPMLEFFHRARAMLKRLQYFSMTPPDAAELAVLRRDAQSTMQHYAVEIKRSPTLSALMDHLQAQAKTDNFCAAEEFMMNFFAAVETTTATLGTAIDRLGVYRAAQERIAAEVSAGETSAQLTCFINETMRYYPPIPFMVRNVATDTEIEGLHLKPGNVIIISTIGIHHHPGYWKHPDRFDCERAEFVEDTYDRRAFIPFATGPRSCGGAKLARLELAEGLKAFIRRFLVTREGDEISFDYALAMRPRSWDSVSIAIR
jgi:cytochrome P450